MKLELSNYEGLPIKKYITVGEYIYNQCHYGRDAKTMTNVIEVVCKEEDVNSPTEIIMIDDFTGSFLLHEKNKEKNREIEVICYFVNNRPSLQKFYNSEKPSFTLAFLIKFEQLLNFHPKWHRELNILNEWRNLVEFDDEFDNTMLMFEKECISQRKTGKQIVGCKNQEDRCLSIELSNYDNKDILQLSLKEVGKLWKTLDTPERIKYISHLCEVRAISDLILPSIRGNRPFLSARSAFKWALKRFITKEGPLSMRKFALLHSKILFQFNKTYLTNFLKRYKTYINEKHCAISTTTH